MSLVSRDSTKLAPSFKIKITQDKDGVHTLQMTGMTLKLSGVYKVVATNKVGTAEHAATISVVGELSFLFPHQSKTLLVPSGRPNKSPNVDLCH